jgi:hypothetical protein
VVSRRGGVPVAPLSDQNQIAKLLEALKEWNCDGFVQWKRLPTEWLRKNLEGYSQKSVGRLMYEYLRDGGEVDAVAETREEYRNLYAYHYDFRIQIGHRFLYIETRFDETRMGPTVYVVNLHDA